MVLIIFTLLVAMPGYWEILRFLASKFYRIGIISGSKAIQVLLSMMVAIMAGFVPGPSWPAEYQNIVQAFETND